MSALESLLNHGDHLAGKKSRVVENDDTGWECLLDQLVDAG
jgi:hypothetical protein